MPPDVTVVDAWLDNVTYTHTTQRLKPIQIEQRDRRAATVWSTPGELGGGRMRLGRVLVRRDRNRTSVTIHPHSVAGTDVATAAMALTDTYKYVCGPETGFDRGDIVDSAEFVYQVHVTGYAPAKLAIQQWARYLVANPPTAFDASCSFGRRPEITLSRLNTHRYGDGSSVTISAVDDVHVLLSFVVRRDVLETVRTCENNVNWNMEMLVWYHSYLAIRIFDMFSLYMARFRPAKAVTAPSELPASAQRAFFSWLGGCDIRILPKDRQALIDHGIDVGQPSNSVNTSKSEQPVLIPRGIRKCLYRAPPLSPTRATKARETPVKLSARARAALFDAAM